MKKCMFFKVVKTKKLIFLSKKIDSCIGLTSQNNKLTACPKKTGGKCPWGF